MRQFFIKLAGVCMLLLTAILLEVFVLGTLPFLAAISLIPFCGMCAMRLLRMGIATKKAARPHRARAPHSPTPRRPQGQGTAVAGIDVYRQNPGAAGTRKAA